MPNYKVKVKWGKENFDGIDLNSDDEPVVFKAQLFALTGVQVDRQKLMFKGKVIGNSWDTVPLKEGMQFLMMGTADKIPEAPKEMPKFIEDMSDNELTTVLDLPSGLANLGNTCYLNATVQCLKTIPELREALQNYNGSAHPERVYEAPGLTTSLRDLFANMDQNAMVTPVVFLAVFHMAFPRFAEKSQDGHFMQHDAFECWTSLLRSLQQDLKIPEPLTESGDGNEQSAIKKTLSFIESYMEGHYVVTLKNTEAETEPETKSVEKFLHLSCFISNHEVKYLQSGLKYSISGESVTKFSPTLQKDCLYTKKSLISRLPAYLTIQIMRYEFKGKEAKILKDVKFSMSLDVFELCTPELQEKLSPMRTKFKEYEDKIDTAKVPKSEAEGAVEKPEKPKFKHPYSFPDDIGSNNSGYYELQAVLTHKGRNIASGHNVAWIRKTKDTWYQCNDDNVNMVTTEDILKLSGGGDWHCAYLLLYGPRILESDEPF